MDMIANRLQHSLKARRLRCDRYLGYLGLKTIILMIFIDFGAVVAIVTMLTGIIP